MVSRCHVLAATGETQKPRPARLRVGPRPRLAPWKLNRTRSIDEPREDIIRLEAEWALTLVACASLTSRKRDWMRRAP